MHYQNRPDTTRSPAELRNVFGENLRLLAQEHPSISDLSRQLGINRTQFNRYLAGESFPRPDILDRICNFFDVDARILLEPVAMLERRRSALDAPFLIDFWQAHTKKVTPEILPSGFYCFSRRSFVRTDRFVFNLIHVTRDTDGATLVKGFEPKDAMRFQGLPQTRKTREFRGFALPHEDGVSLMIARKGLQTFSFNYLSRASSLESNFWAGYVARTSRPAEHAERVTRLVYEYIGHDQTRARAFARLSGFKTLHQLPTFHQHLLRPQEGFR